MGIVDLRGRADDAEVRALAPHPCPPLVGWSEEGRLVGCVGIERVADREIELRGLIVLAEFRRRGIGRSLVETVVNGAPVERFRVECGADTAGFFERCGFTRSFDGALIRDVPIEPDPAATAAFTLSDLEAALRASWSQETSADPQEWTAENPARGQCDATAVVLRRYLGGEILVADVLRSGRRVERHAWNRLSSGLTLDLTRDQFRAGEELGTPTAAEPLLIGNARERHALLAERVAAALAAHRL